MKSLTPLFGFEKFGLARVLLRSTFMSTEHNDTWIVGLDLDERCLGALVFASWLAEAGDTIVGVHVLEAWIRPHIRNETVLAKVDDMVARTAKALGLTPPTRLSPIEAVQAEEGLTAACTAEFASGLIIGRVARTDQAPFTRLGVVARRLLRELPAPVIVVPPDLTTIGGGPVILAVDLTDTTEAAVSFARALAARHHRPLEIVHVGQRRRSSFIPDFNPSWVDARREYHDSVVSSVNAWTAKHALSDIPQHVMYGDPAEEVARVATSRKAALVVVGSRHLGLVGRAFLSSTASALAGRAGCPVAVVPSSAR